MLVFDELLFGQGHYKLTESHPILDWAPSVLPTPCPWTLSKSETGGGGGGGLVLSL